MELEEIQDVWKELSDQLEQQKKLTNEIILKMTQQNYSAKFQRISTFETIGAVVCFIVAIYVIINFDKLDTWYLMLCGGITLATLLVLPILTLRALNRIKGIRIAEMNYKDAIMAFEAARKRLFEILQVTLAFSAIIFFATIPVASKLISNKDFFAMNKEPWLYGFIAVVMVGLFFYSRWGYRCYKKIANSAANVIKDLE